MVHVGYPAVMVLSLVPRPACVDQVAMSLYVYYPVEGSRAAPGAGRGDLQDQALGGIPNDSSFTH
jgi:hypothetical protein